MYPTMLAPEIVTGAAQMLVSLATAMVVVWSCLFTMR